MPNAVLFDLDNTLIDRDQAFRESVAAYFDDAVVRAELVRLDADGRGDRQTLFAAWMKFGGGAMTQSRLGALIAGQLRPARELIEALRVLGREIKLGVITNGGSETQRRKFQAAGLSTVIPNDRLWISEEVGTAKPDAAIFRLATRTLEERPEDCLFIGDHEEIDVLGARAAGLRARLVAQVLDAPRLRQLMEEEGR